MFFALLACAALPPVTDASLDLVDGSPTAVQLSFTRNAPGPVWAEIDGERTTPPTDGNSLTLLALTAGQDHAVVIHHTASDGTEWSSEPGSVSIPSAPPSLPRFTILTNTGEGDPHALFLTTLIAEENNWLVLIDREGELAWWMASPDGHPLPQVHLDDSGQGVILPWMNVYDGELPRAVLEADFAGSAPTFTEAPDLHHDARRLPDGSLVYIAGETLPGTALDDGEVVDLAVDRIDILRPGAPEAERLFSFLDDYPVAPWRHCSDFDEPGYGDGKNYTHANSLMVSDDGAALYVMSRHLDAVVKVDAATGAFLWQLGGRDGEFTDVAGDTISYEEPWKIDGPNATWWSHGHMSQLWPGGMMVFDNGSHHSTPVSRIVEYAFDESDRTVELRHAFESPSRSLNAILGDARKLDNGHYAAAWTFQGELTESDAAGELVWRAGLDMGTIVGRMQVLDDPYGRTNPEWPPED